MLKNEEVSKLNKSASFAFVLHCMIGILICLIISFLFSILISSEKLPETSIQTLSFASVFVGACVAGILSAKKFGKNLLSAISQGVFLFAVIYIIGCLLFKRLSPTDLSPLIPIACFSGGIFGGIIASLKKRKRK